MHLRGRNRRMNLKCVLQIYSSELIESTVQEHGQVYNSTYKALPLKLDFFFFLLAAGIFNFLCIGNTLAV